MSNRATPLISFLIPTCGRMAKQPYLLNEAVWHCLNQTYPNIEVLVLNDAPGQTLRCMHPNVRIVNENKRYSDLGTKMNAMFDMAQGEICLVSEDDDISLSHRATQAFGKLKGDSYDWWEPRLWCYAESGKPARIDGNGTGYTSCAFRRKAFLGKHKPMIIGHDQAAVNWARIYLRASPGTLWEYPQEVSYVYRWGVSIMHLSGCPDVHSAWHNYDPGPDGTYDIYPENFTNWSFVVQESAERFKNGNH